MQQKAMPSEHLIIQAYEGIVLAKITKERILRLGISEYDFEFLTIIPMGCFGVKLPDERIRFVQVTPSKTILNLSFTNTAAERMTTRVPYMSIPEVRQRAMAAGLL